MTSFKHIAPKGLILDQGITIPHAFMTNLIRGNDLLHNTASLGCSPNSKCLLLAPASNPAWGWDDEHNPTFDTWIKRRTSPEVENGLFQYHFYVWCVSCVFQNSLRPSGRQVLLKANRIQALRSGILKTNAGLFFKKKNQKQANQKKPQQTKPVLQPMDALISTVVNLRMTK